MKYVVSAVFIGIACAALAQTVGEVRATTTRMSPQTLQRLFLLKPGERFTPQRYEKAQDELHKLRVFKKLNFSEDWQGDTVNLHIDAQDGAYWFPIGFITGGSKSAAGLSVALGNVFKQGESIFLFGGAGQDGWTANIGLHTPQHTVLLGYTRLDVDRRFYRDDWFNIPNVFSTADDKEDHSHELLREIKGTQDKAVLVYKYRLSRTLRAVVRPEYNEISYAHRALDSGKHHQLGVGLTWSDDIRAGMNMGALAGYGLTDKAQALRDLPHIRTGYMGSMLYTGGGRWTGSDYTVSKLALENAWMLELKSRHLFHFRLAYQQAFQAPFSDKIVSTDLLGGLGRYDRQRRGKRGFGGSIAFVYYMLRNRTGLLSVTPFYELAYVDSGAGYRPHSGLGGALMYKLWRFPLPFGVNYTHNLQDGSHQIGFAVGGMF